MTKQLNWKDNKPQASSILSGDLIVGKFGPKKVPSYIQRSKLRGYKVHTAGITQTGSNNPTDNVLVNELGLGNISWLRNSAGEYTGTLKGLYTKYDKVGIVIGLGYTSNVPGLDSITITVRKIDNNSFKIFTTEELFASNNDNILTNTLFEIRAYY